jgi:antitoxin MazE
MKTRLQKWGNSLALRVPKSFAAELRLAENAPVDMVLEDGALVVRPGKDGTWDLGSLLEGITEENLRPAWDREAAAEDAGPEEGEPGTNGHGR